MNAITQRVVALVVALTLVGASSASARPRRGGVVVPRVYAPFVYDPFWGPWHPYAYGYPYGIWPYADVRTQVTPKDAEIYVDG